LEARSRLDLGGLGSSCDREQRRNNPRRGLKALSRVILGVDLPKPKSQILSDWSQVPLTEDQVMYSARDAWAAAAIVNRLAEQDPATFGNSNLIQMLESYETPTSNLMQRKDQRQRAKDELDKLLQPYKKVSPNSSASKAPAHPARNLPERVVAKVRKLRDVIKTVKKDHPMPIEVDHLGFEFDDDYGK
jgi:ribonuclease D